MEKVRFVSSGTEATMSAIRLARAYTRRKYIVKFEGCYHGHADSLLVKAGSGVATLGIPGSAGVIDELARYTLALPLQRSFRAGAGVCKIQGRNSLCDRGTGGGQHGLRTAMPGLSGWSARDDPPRKKSL